MRGRVLALDLGGRRIGMAVSDALGITAQGLPTWERKNKRQDLEAIAAVVREREVALVVVGNPLHLSGTEGAKAHEAARFAEDLSRHCVVRVQLWDERLSTKEAGRVLRESGVSLDKRRRAIDRLSAVLILQSYLDFVSQQPRTEPELAE